MATTNARKKKILWVVHYDDVNTFLRDAQQYGVTGVAIRTDNDIDSAIPLFHAAGLEVYGWRWPSAKRDPAMKEARKAAALFAKGLDGYYVDPEGEPGKSYDWDLPGLAGLATDFCDTVAQAAGSKPFGVTSHWRGKVRHPNLPWAAFFRRATVLLPQAYWRVDAGTVGAGEAQRNYADSIGFWQAAGGNPALIAPMAGELHKVTAAEIAVYAAQATAAGREMHFYAHLPTVKPAVRAAVSAA